MRTESPPVFRWEDFTHASDRIRNTCGGIDRDGTDRTESLRRITHEAWWLIDRRGNYRTYHQQRTDERLTDLMSIVNDIAEAVCQCDGLAALPA